MSNFFISPLTGKEVSKATYYRHMKKFQSQFQSQSHETFSSLDSQYDALFKVFKDLFLAASSRGIPKKIVQECERFL